MASFLRTQRLLLREITDQDTPLLLELDQDPEVMRFLTAGLPSTFAEISATITRVRTIYQQTQRKFGLWAAFTVSDEFIGWFHLRPGKSSPDDETRLELGYRLLRRFWGQGYGTEVSRALINYAFRWPTVELVFATAMLGNKASQRIMEKLGMTQTLIYQEPSFPAPDKTSVRYEIRRVDWAGRA